MLYLFSFVISIDFECGIKLEPQSYVLSYKAHAIHTDNIDNPFALYAASICIFQTLLQEFLFFTITRQLAKAGYLHRKEHVGGI